MDVSRYRLAAPQLRRFPGTRQPVSLRPLPQNTLDKARAGVEALFGFEGLPCEGGAFDRAVALAVLRLATGETLEHITLRQAAELSALWVDVQDASTLDDDALDRLDAEIELQIAEGKGIAAGDATAAAQCPTPQDFYGRHALDLTDGQLLYYLSLRAVHARVYGEEERCVSLEELRRRAGR
ncbi:MAG: hypothetical protein KC503_17385 [Myxococcales bacterium]|nr:hypothetical protein [Myxococcales bacterium]